MEKKKKIGLIVGIIVIGAAATASGWYLYALYNPVQLRVFIASSLVAVVANYTNEFEQQNFCQLLINSGSSSALEGQIVMGSPCDVFMSADVKWCTALNSSGMLDNNSYWKFCTNNLTVILPASNPKNIQSLSDLVQSGVKIVVAAVSVPVGSYTNQTVIKINNTWGNSSDIAHYVSSGLYVNYYTNFWSHVTQQEISDEAVVGDILNNATSYDAGVVFSSDGAVQGSRLQYVQIPTAVNYLGTYGIAAIKTTNATTTALAEKFVQFWLSATGQSLLSTFGFGLL